MAIELPENPDLAWDLDEIINRQQAEQFVMQFETTLCVYSGTVEQLYSNYHIFFPTDQGRKMVILPDPAAYHDTFHGVHPEAVSETGLYVVPGELIGRSGLYVTNLLKDRRMGPRQIPFEQGMRKIMTRRPDTDPFLPVLAKGDLREFEQRWPVLHLHRIELSKLMDRSALERKGIQDVVMEKIEELFDIQRYS